MTRQEFSQLLADIRKMAKCSMNETARRTGMGLVQIQYIEKNFNNYSLINVIKYLAALGRVIRLTHNGQMATILEYRDVPVFLRQIRVLENISQKQLALIIGRSVTHVTGMENQVSAMHIDSFLAITSALKIKIELKYR